MSAGDSHSWLPEFDMVHMLDHLTADMTNVKLLALDLNYDCSKLNDIFRNWSSGTTKSAKLELDSLVSLILRLTN
jgi:hypothetical protein